MSTTRFVKPLQTRPSRAHQHRATLRAACATITAALNQSNEERGRATGPLKFGFATMDPGVAALAEVFGRTVSNDRVRCAALARACHCFAGARDPAACVACGAQEVIKAAEEQLKAASSQPGYGITVLKVL